MVTKLTNKDGFQVCDQAATFQPEAPYASPNAAAASLDQYDGDLNWAVSIELLDWFQVWRGSRQ